MPTVYELMRFKDKEELEKVYTDIIKSHTKQTDASAEIRDISKFQSLNENADLFSVTLRQHLRHGRPVGSFIHKVYKDQAGENAGAQYESEGKVYALSNEIKPARYGFAHQREIGAFPRCYFDNMGELKKRRSYFLEDISAERITVHDELSKTQGKLIWEGLAPALDPVILLTDFIPAEAYYRNYLEALKLKDFTVEEFTEELSSAVTDLFTGGISHGGYGAIYGLASRYISCEDRKDQRDHLTIVKKKISPADNNTLSLIDGSDLVYASRMLPLGSFFCNPEIYSRMARREELAENVFESYFRRREELVMEKNVKHYELPLGEFSAGFYLGGAHSNFKRAAFLLRALPGVEDEKMKEKIIGRVKNLEGASLEQISRMIELDLPKEDKSLIKDLYSSIAEAAKRSKV